MNKKQSDLKRSIQNNGKSVEKSTLLKLSKPKLNPQPNSPAFTRSEKKQIEAEAKEVKNKIGKFLSKMKNKADGILKEKKQANFLETGQQQIEQSSRTTDPYQFRKINIIKLEKGEKKAHLIKGFMPSNQYYSQAPKIQQNGSASHIHPSIRDIKEFKQTVSTSSSNKKLPKQLIMKQITKQIKLQDFEIGRELGAGKYGHVFIAKHKKTGMIFALKKICKKDLDETMVKQICHQIKIQFLMDHPNIVKLYGFFHDKNAVYLLLQLSTSGHLYEYLQKKTIVEQTSARNIVKQICTGLEHLHKFNIIHRDVKLQNALYQMGIVKICDFGWSIQTEDLRETFCGTPLYIAPQILLQKGYDRKIDVWCVGILTFELLYGKVPFQIREQKDFLKIVNEQVKFPSEPTTSKSARNFIVQCLMKDPELRPNFDELLLHSFLEKADFIKFSQLF